MQAFRPSDLQSDAIVHSATSAQSRRMDSNHRPPVYKTGALPLSYIGTLEQQDYSKKVNEHEADDLI